MRIQAGRRRAGLATLRLGAMLALALLGSVCLPATSADERVALVVGNSNYRHLKALDNPANDAEAVARRLQQLGFTLIGEDGRPTRRPLLDLEEDALVLAATRFAEVASGSRIAFVYYAGHGMQLHGRSYLLPVDLSLRSPELLRRNSLSLDDLLNWVDGQAELTLAVFDACREIPELASLARHRSLGGSAMRGLARIDDRARPGRHRIVAFSAAAGELAPDGEPGGNSPYTQALLQELGRPGQEVGDLFRRVAAHVADQGRLEPEVLIQGVRPDQWYLASGDASASQVPAQSPAVGYLQVNLTFAGERHLRCRDFRRPRARFRERFGGRGAATGSEHG
jgi:uncharacterized caspase-like protein